MHQLSLFEGMDQTEYPVAATADQLEKRALFLKSCTMLTVLRDRYYELQENERYIDAYYLLKEFDLS